MSAQTGLQRAIERARGREGGPTALRVEVRGLPLPKGSPTILRNRKSGKPFVREKPSVVGWQDTVRQIARARAYALRFAPLDQPVRVRLAFTLPRIRSAAKSATALELAAVKPDLDKLARACLDALEGVAYTTDSRVTSMRCTKRTGLVPGVAIVVEIDNEADA